MRNPTHRLCRAALSGAVLLALTTGAVAPATAETPADTPATAQAVEVAKKSGTGSSDLGSVAKNSFSSQLGADDLQKWYNGSPGWARVLLSIVTVALALDALGILIGPLRSMLFNILPR
ncbi:hypothetical protein M0E87_11005 [Corynebacterium sp. CCM 9185]|uniref:Secreted protein n=1 Tax=Corynebacterium marambiense TaxID=2765364 RepID=A0ABS0VVQ6_9CORY|nr:hypothetical protein [Corynebacterium marambiense]MBI9000426.1 hypothetical protein [Corynebacterium marambiense]MCK7664179.1 hypothetical protein [Corynebacterium marambiense]